MTAPKERPPLPKIVRNGFWQEIGPFFDSGIEEADWATGGFGRGGPKRRGRGRRVGEASSANRGRETACFCSKNSVEVGENASGLTESSIASETGGGVLSRGQNDDKDREVGMWEQ